MLVYERPFAKQRYLLIFKTLPEGRDRAPVGQLTSHFHVEIATGHQP
jgi:hypothetical protein